MKAILKYYFKAVIYPTIVVLVLTTIISVGKTPDALDFMFYKMTFALFYCAFISVLALPILLNKWIGIYSNRNKSLITWFLLPFCFIGITVVEMIITDGFYRGFYYFLHFNLAFIIGLIWSFQQFRKDLITKKVYHYEPKV